MKPSGDPGPLGAEKLRPMKRIDRFDKPIVDLMRLMKKFDSRRAEPSR
jgi:hypothetical protein